MTGETIISITIFIESISVTSLSSTHAHVRDTALTGRGRAAVMSQLSSGAHNGRSTLYYDYDVTVVHQKGYVTYVIQKNCHEYEGFKLSDFKRDLFVMCKIGGPWYPLGRPNAYCKTFVLSKRPVQAQDIVVSLSLVLTVAITFDFLRHHQRYSRTFIFASNECRYLIEF